MNLELKPAQDDQGRLQACFALRCTATARCWRKKSWIKTPHTACDTDLQRWPRKAVLFYYCEERQRRSAGLEHNGAEKCKRRVSGCHRDRRKHFKGTLPPHPSGRSTFPCFVCFPVCEKRRHVESTAEQNPCVKAGMMKGCVFVPYFKGPGFVFNRFLIFVKEAGHFQAKCVKFGD